MKRIQIQLTEDQFKALKARSSIEHKSIADLIREAVDDLLGKGARIDSDDSKRRAVAAAGQFNSSVKDLAANHDFYLRRAIADDDSH